MRAKQLDPSRLVNWALQQITISQWDESGKLRPVSDEFMNGGCGTGSRKIKFVVEMELCVEMESSRQSTPVSVLEKSKCRSLIEVVSSGDMGLVFWHVWISQTRSYALKLVATIMKFSRC